jgi:hypothetical protein
MFLSGHRLQVCKSELGIQEESGLKDLATEEKVELRRDPVCSY